MLARAKAAGLTTKSGLILGMGETEAEVAGALGDLRGVGCDIVTIGQYLRPTARHLPVARWWTPEEFDRLKVVGEAMGIPHVESSPLTRSSYHARQAAAQAAPVSRGRRCRCERSTPLTTPRLRDERLDRVRSRPWRRRWASTASSCYARGADLPWLTGYTAMPLERLTMLVPAR